MAQLAAIVPVLTAGAAIVGAGAAVVGAVDSYNQGVQAKQEADRQAAVDIANGKSAFAASQREADQRKLEGKLIASRAMAYAAASGGGSGSDAPTIQKILTDIGRNAQMGADTAYYQGEQAQADYNNDASARRASGQNSYFGGILRAFGTLAGGVGHLGETSSSWLPKGNTPGLNFTPATGNLY